MGNPFTSFSFFFFFFFTAIWLTSASPSPSVTLTLIPANSNLSPFKSSPSPPSLDQINAHDKARLIYLDNLIAKTDVPVGSGRQFQQAGNYLVKANVGTPGQTLFMVMDTSNDAAWVPCSGCTGCSSPTLFTLEQSTTFKPLQCGAAQCRQVSNSYCTLSDCHFNMTYGDSSFEALLSVDSLTLASSTIPSYAFGCLKSVTGTSIPPQGLLGLGRGPLSLLSQAGTLYQKTFSYCLPNAKSMNFSGSLRLGPVGQPTRILYTPLLTNPRRPSLYYVNMTGIKVGRRTVNIPPNVLAFDPTTGAGTIFDSGTMVTRLVAPAYVAVRDEFRRRINQPVTSLGGFDTCYSTPIVPPTITFQFDGMNMTLPEENVLIHSTYGTTSCLAMAAAPVNVNSVVNVIATMQQQNHRVLYDIPNSRLGVSRELCT
ncbi:aspartyl protease AED3-like [Nymphaea colorata]|nr:aspartyl protease AED3-like [Nymphaea colorata]